MTPEEARVHLEALVEKGFMVRNDDGTYSPTALGRLVVNATSGRYNN